MSQIHMETDEMIPEEIQYDETQLLLIEVVETLYRRNAFEDFRLPVLVSYPHLKEPYLKIIDAPMDLGTLLVKLLRKELNPLETSFAIKKICDNAMTYNAGYSLLENAAKHLCYIASSLFEEITGFGFCNTDTPNQVRSRILSERAKRYALLSNRSFNLAELDILLKKIKSFVEIQVQKLGPIVTEWMQGTIRLLDSIVRTRLEYEASRRNYKMGEDDDDEDDNDVSKDATVFSLNYVFEPLVVSCLSMVKTNASPAIKVPLGKVPLIDHLFKGGMVPKHLLQLLTDLDNSLGKFIVFVEERILRGCGEYSSFWLIPYQQCVWCQLNKDTSRKDRDRWMPAMIVMSNSPAYKMNQDIMDLNVKRLPEDIIKALLKLRPRLAKEQKASNNNNNNNNDTISAGNADQRDSKSEVLTFSLSPPMKSGGGSSKAKAAAADKTMNSLTCPEGHVLVEFFGEHDLGWIKAECVIPMSHDGGIPAGVVITKSCPQKIIEEAEFARKDIWRIYRRHRQPRPDQVDLPGLPSLADLEASISATPSIKPKVASAVKARDMGVSTRKVLPSIKCNLKARDFMIDLKVCVKDGEFMASMCPRPAQLHLTAIPSGFSTLCGLNYRRNALVRSRAAAMWMQSKKPVILQNAGIFPETEPDLVNPDLEKIISKVPLNHNHQNVQQQTFSHLAIKNLPFLKNPRQSPVEEEPAESVDCGPVQTYVNVGCTRHVTGRGLYTARKIDFSAPLFFRESEDPVVRVQAIKSDIAFVKGRIELLQNMLGGSCQDNANDIDSEEHSIEMEMMEES